MQIRERTMAKLHVVSALLLGTPLLQSCTSAPTVEPYGVKAQASTVRHAGETAAAYYHVGRYYQGQNRLDAAATAYEKALSLDSGYFEARNGLGVIYSARGKMDLAVEQFVAAIAQSPRSAHLHNNLAQAYYLQGKFEESVRSFETAVSLDPNNFGALARLSQAYAKAGMSNKSQQALRTVQSSQAQAQSAVANLLGRPGAVALEPSASAASAGSSIVAPPPPTTTPVTAAAARTVAVTPPSLSAVTPARTPDPARRPPGAEPISSHTAITGKLVPISPDVYELVVPASAASRPSLPSPVLPQLSQTQRPVITLQRDISKPMVSISSARTADVRITSVAPGIYQMETFTPSPVAAPIATAIALASQPIIASVKSVPAASSRSVMSRAVIENSNSRATAATVHATDRIRVEVANGNGVRGIAKRVSTKLRQFEHYVARLSNQRPMRNETSVEYRDGYIEEAASVAAGLDKRVALIPSDHLRRDIHVRLVLGRDVRSEVALFESWGWSDTRVPRPTAARKNGHVSEAPNESIQQPTQSSTNDVVIDKLIRAAGDQKAGGFIPRMAMLARASVDDGKILIVWQ
jgi:Tfp pilus assembly protein PilF